MSGVGLDIEWEESKEVGDDSDADAERPRWMMLEDGLMRVDPT